MLSNKLKGNLGITQKNDLLVREFNKHFERKTLLELQIALQRELDPIEVSAKKPLEFNSAGQPISYQKIKRSEHIEILEESLKDVELTLKVIEEQFEL